VVSSRIGPLLCSDGRCPSGLDLDVTFVGEHADLTLVLPVGEQVGPGAQHPADAVERVTDAAAVPQVCCWTH
jgi:hypothetical protein